MSVSRRGFLLAVAAGTVAGCSGGAHPKAVATTTTSTTVGGTAQPSADLAVAARAAAVENSLVTGYGSVLSGNRAGPFPAGLKGLWQTFQSHHRDHATAWNAILTAAGATVVTSGDSAFDGTVVRPGLASVKDLDGAIAFIVAMEQAVAATYLAAIDSTLTTPGALQTAAAIQPIELQHVAMLGALTQSDPVPASFATTAGALSLA